jgi:hypothetical protein
MHTSQSSWTNNNPLSSPPNDPTAANLNAFLHTGVTVTQSQLGTQSTFLHGDSGNNEDGVDGMHRMENTSSTLSHNRIFSPPDGRFSAATSTPVGAATRNTSHFGTQSTFLHGDIGDDEDGVNGMHPRENTSSTTLSHKHKQSTIHYNINTPATTLRSVNYIMINLQRQRPDKIKTTFFYSSI